MLFSSVLNCLTIGGNHVFFSGLEPTYRDCIQEETGRRFSNGLGDFCVTVFGPSITVFLVGSTRVK